MQLQIFEIVKRVHLWWASDVILTPIKVAWMLIISMPSAYLYISIAVPLNNVGKLNLVRCTVLTTPFIRHDKNTFSWTWSLLEHIAFHHRLCLKSLYKADNESRGWNNSEFSSKEIDTIIEKQMSYFFLKPPGLHITRIEWKMICQLSWAKSSLTELFSWICRF